MITTICLLAKDQDLRITKVPIIATGNVNSVLIDVKTDEMWNGYNLSAVFYNDLKKAFEVLLTDGKCVVPHEVIKDKKPFFIGLRGTTADKKKTSTVVSYTLKQGSPEANATAEGPTQDVYQQILQQLEELEMGVPDEKIEEAVNKYLEENPLPTIAADEEFSTTSTNPLQNKVITQKFEEVTTEINNVKANVGEAELLLAAI